MIFTFYVPLQSFAVMIEVGFPKTKRKSTLFSDRKTFVDTKLHVPPCFVLAKPAERPPETHSPRLRRVGPSVNRFGFSRNDKSSRRNNTGATKSGRHAYRYTCGVHVDWRFRNHDRVSGVRVPARVASIGLAKKHFVAPCGVRSSRTRRRRRRRDGRYESRKQSNGVRRCTFFYSTCNSHLSSVDVERRRGSRNVP